MLLQDVFTIYWYVAILVFIVIVDLSVLRASARYNVNKIGHRQSPCGAPIFVVIFFTKFFSLFLHSIYIF